MPTLRPTLTDVRWGPGYSQKYDVLRHPIRDSGGNPCLIYRHGGSGVLRDKRLPFVASGNFNALFYHLHHQRQGASDAHFDLISIESRQGRFTTPITQHPNDDAYNWRDSRVDRAVYFPHWGDEMKLATLAVKSRARDLGIDPTKVIIAGTSFGSLCAAYAASTAPLCASDLPSSVRSAYALAGGFDSRPAGAIMHQALTDTRSRYQKAPRALITDGLTWSESAKTLTGSGCFTTFDKVAANGVIEVTGGTGANRGLFEVAYVDPAGNYLRLTNSIGAAADAQTDIAIRYQGFPPTIYMTSATFTNATKTLTKTNAFQTWGHGAEDIIVSAGTGVTTNRYFVASRTDKSNIVLTADIGGTNPSDVSAYMTGDVIAYGLMFGVFGAYTQAEWDALPRGMRQAASIMHYVENGDTKWMPPLLAVSEQIGNGITPYGNFVVPGDDVHDSKMVTDLVAAAGRYGASNISGMVLGGGWTDGVAAGVRDANSSLVYDWMKAAIGGGVGGRRAGQPLTVPGLAACPV